MRTKKKDGQYTVVVSCLGQKVTGSGDTILETLEAMQLRNVRGRSIVSVTHNGVTKERIFMAQVVMRAFNTQGITRNVSLKLIASQFYGI